MLEVQHLDDLKAVIKNYKKQSKSIGFVPTMGNLHVGHLSLVKKARELCDVVVVSIFVNPLQFGPNEDLDNYPRTLKKDLELLTNEDCDCVFLPSKNAMLNNENTTRVTVPIIREGMEGDMREGHLDGVATIVTKLFNLVQPDIACFGKKDYQQWLMIKKLVADLNLDIEIIGCETQREANGLARSSRNQYLQASEREKAPLFRQTLLKCVKDMQSLDPKLAIAAAKKELINLGFSIDYLELRKQLSLEPTLSSQHAVLISTVRLGETRLLDNIELPF